MPGKEQNTMLQVQKDDTDLWQTFNNHWKATVQQYAFYQLFGQKIKRTVRWWPTWPAQEQLVWELQHFHHYSEVHWRMLIQNRNLQCRLSPVRLSGRVRKTRSQEKEEIGEKKRTDMKGKLLFNKQAWYTKILRHCAIKPLIYFWGIF